MIASHMFLAVGPWQIVLIVLVVLLLFGGKKIPELMRGLGSGIKEFKDASRDDDKSSDKKELKIIYAEKRATDGRFFYSNFTDLIMDSNSKI